MDFIERIFHISPDGGTGVLELAIAFALLVIPFFIVKVRKQSNFLSQRSAAGRQGSVGRTRRSH
jgi:hypothetical protein